MERALDEKFRNKEDNGIVVKNSLGFIIGTSNGQGIKHAIRESTKYLMEHPNEEEFIIFCTRYPTLEEAKEITNLKRIKKLVTLFPYLNEDGLNYLESSGVEIFEEPITVNDIIVENGNVILRRADLNKITESGIIIPDSVVQARTRGVICEVVACDFEIKDFKEGDLVLVDIISCQWLTLKNENCTEDKYFTTIAKEILFVFDEKGKK